MLKSNRMGIACLTMLFAFATASPAKADSVPPVRHLHLVNGNASQVRIAWEAPSSASTGSATIDKYIIKRDGDVIKTLEGLNGIVETSYTDGSPSSKDATYTVVAVDSRDKRSPPATLAVPAPEAASSQPPAGKDPADGLQSSNLCESIISPDVRGRNRPTALEKYGCGKGLSTVHDKGPDKVLGIAKPRPVHDFFQNVFIQLPVSLGQTFFLVISALSIWVMLPGTYTGIARLFGSLLQAFNGNPNYPALVGFALGLAIIFMAYRYVKDQIRRGYETAAIIIVVLALLTVFLANPFRTMRYTVDKPLSLYAGITNEITGMISGTDVSDEFNLTVHPTFSGNKTHSAIRKAENIDFLMYQYLPQCAMNFNNFNWVMTHRVPDTNITFCERFVQVYGAGDDDDVDKFEDQLEKANKDIYSFYNGGDQSTRVQFALLSKFTLTLHNLLKFVMKMSLYVCELLLLAEILFAVLWLIYSMSGSDSSRATAERRIRSIFHWIRIPVLLLIITLIQQTVEAYIVSASMRSGFLWLTTKELIWNVMVVIGTIIICRKLHQDYKQSKDRLVAYRDDERSRLATGAAAGAAVATGVGAAALATGKGLHKAGQWLRGDGSDGHTQGENIPRDAPFSNQFRTPQLALPAGESDGNGGGMAALPPGSPDVPSSGNNGGGGFRTQKPGDSGPAPTSAPVYDFNGRAEPIIERPQIERHAGVPDQVEPLPESRQIESSTGSSDQEGPMQVVNHSDRKSPGSEGNGRTTYDEPIIDATVIEDDQPPSMEIGEFRTQGDTRF